MENLNLVRLELEEKITSRMIKNEIMNESFVVLKNEDESILKLLCIKSGKTYFCDKNNINNIKYMTINTVRIDNMFIGEHNVLLSEQQYIITLISEYRVELGFKSKDVIDFILAYKNKPLINEYKDRFEIGLSDCLYFMDFVGFLVSYCFENKVKTGLTNTINSFKYNNYSKEVKYDLCVEYIKELKEQTKLDIGDNIYKDIKYSVNNNLILNVKDLIFLAVNNC